MVYVNLRLFILELHKCVVIVISTLMCHYYNNFTFVLYIGTSNDLLTGEMVNVDSPNDATVLCTFLCEFNSSAHCRVQYGTDPTYMNLPYSAVSTETGTAEDSVSVVLREQLNSSTVYYYSVSSIVGDVTVRVQGTFITPQYSKYLHVCWLNTNYEKNEIFCLCVP